VNDYAPSKISPEQVNPVRQLCDEYGIATRLTDGDSCYIGESGAGGREILFFDSDGTAVPDDGEAETELWDTYDLVMEKVWELEDEMVADDDRTSPDHTIVTRSFLALLPCAQIPAARS
jgi:hypothetical protein